MTIHIEALCFDVIIGLLDFERTSTQSIIIDIEATYDYIDGDFINYADIVLSVQNELKIKKYKLLEDALLGLKTLLYQSYPNLQTLYIKIIKPDILAQCRVGLSQDWKF